jgi:hypothetical protein
VLLSWISPSNHPKRLSDPVEVRVRGLNDAEREGADGALWVYVCAEAHGCSGVVRQLLWWGRRYFWDNFPSNQRANRTPNTA